MEKSGIDELIQWFLDDLEQQRVLFREICEVTDVPDSKLTLNMSGFKDAGSIDFNFDFHDILQRLGVTERGDDYNIVCPYAIDFSEAVFNKYADFGSITFKEEVYFGIIKFTGAVVYVSTTCTYVGATFSEGVNFGFSTFVQNANFSGVTFVKDTKYVCAVFMEEAKFFNTIFLCSVGCYFEDRVCNRSVYRRNDYSVSFPR